MQVGLTETRPSSLDTCAVSVIRHFQPTLIATVHYDEQRRRG